MSLQQHKKHSDLAKPVYGNFGRKEWSFLGTNCGVIKSLADAIIAKLSPRYSCAYIDASHAGEGTGETLPGRLSSGATLEYTQQVGYHQFNHLRTPSTFALRQASAGADLVLVNGNHFEATAQVIVIDPQKEASLQKRMSQVTNLQMILLAEGVTTPFGFVKAACPNWASLPVYPLSETDNMVQFFEGSMKNALPALKGLVLAGGKSIRMGTDKAKIEWFGKEQRYHLADILQQHCTSVLISCRQGQESGIDAAYTALPDSFTGLGPMGAILSAFRHDPDAAWLVAACDMPLLNAAVFNQLLEQRDPAMNATCFESPSDGLPEPLISIWEPKSYPLLLSCLAQGYSCPRKILANSEIRLVSADDPDLVTNVNTPEEAEKARAIISQRRSNL